MAPEQAEMWSLDGVRVSTLTIFRLTSWLQLRTTSVVVKQEGRFGRLARSWRYVVKSGMRGIDSCETKNNAGDPLIGAFLGNIR